jgi:uncharacterized Rossmann fold enzyme
LYGRHILRDKFNKEHFLNEVNKKDKVIVCGNSPKFPESFKKIQNTDNAFIIRFNAVLDNLPEDSKVDTLFINDGKMLYDYDVRKWESKCTVYLRDDLYRNELALFTNYPENITTGLIVLIFLVNNIDPKKIILVGFDMVNNYREKAKWYGGKFYNLHNIDNEKQILNEIVERYNIIKY